MAERNYKPVRKPAPPLPCLSTNDIISIHRVNNDPVINPAPPSPCLSTVKDIISIHRGN